MKRGGHVSDSHTNRHVGKIDKYKFEIDPDTGKEGVYLWGHIFKNFSADDVVWEKIKSGEYSGLSFGGRELDGGPRCESWGCYNEMREGELWEWAIVPRGANQNANITKYNEVAKGMDVEGRIAELEGDVRDLKKMGDHSEQMRDCVTGVQEDQGYSPERAENICASQLFNKADPDTISGIFKYDEKLQSNGRQMLANDMVKLCPHCKSEYVKMLDTMGPNDALGEIQKSLDLLRDNMTTDTKKQEEEIPAGTVGEEEMDPLQAIMERLDQFEARLNAIENPEPVMEEPMMEEENVYASETGAPVRKEEPVETEPTPPSQSEQEEKELNEGVTTDTVKSLVKKEVAKALGDKHFVAQPARRPPVDRRPALDKMNAQTGQVGQKPSATPVGTEQWRDIAKADYSEVHDQAKKTLRGE